MVEVEEGAESERERLRVGRYWKGNIEVDAGCDGEVNVEVELDADGETLESGGLEDG